MCFALVRCVAVVQPFAQFLAGAEKRHTLLLDRNRLAGARIAPLTRGAHFDGERAEAAKLHAIAIRKGGGDFIQYGGNDALDVAMIKMRIALGEARHQFRLDHSPAPAWQAEHATACRPNLPNCHPGVNWGKR